MALTHTHAKWPGGPALTNCTIQAAVEMIKHATKALERLSIVAARLGSWISDGDCAFAVSCVKLRAASAYRHLTMQDGAHTMADLMARVRALRRW